MKDHKVVLMGSSHYHGLNLARSFGEKGIKPYGIIIGAYTNHFLESSRYWEYTWNVETEEEGIELLLKEFSKFSEKTVVIPWSDSAGAALDLNLDRLSDSFLLPSIHGKQGEIVYWMDKDRQLDLAKYLNLPTSPSRILSIPASEQEMRQLFDTLHLPYIVKPVASFEGEKSDIRKICSEEELSAYLPVLQKHGYQRILVQEYLQIEREYDFLGMCTEGTSSYTILEKLRTWPTEGGSTSFGKVIRPGQDAANYEKIIKQLADFGYNGPFDIDLFAVQGKLYFNEINWRSSANVFAAILGDNNYPYLWYRCVTEPCKNTRRRIRSYQGSERLFMNEVTDFRHVIHREISLAGWCSDRKRCLRFAFWNRKDPKPYWVRMAGPFTTLMARLQRKAGRK